MLLMWSNLNAESNIIFRLSGRHFGEKLRNYLSDINTKSIIWGDLFLFPSATKKKKNKTQWQHLYFGEIRSRTGSNLAISLAPDWLYHFSAHNSFGYPLYRIMLQITFNEEKNHQIINVFLHFQLKRLAFRYRFGPLFRTIENFEFLFHLWKARKKIFIWSQKQN